MCTRLYYGTDVRTQEVMVGALLAIGLPAFVRRVRRAGRPTRRMAYSAVTVLGGAAALALLWGLHAVSGQGAFLYEGGFLLVATATAGVILLVVVRPRAVVSRVLSLGFLGYVGRISYGLYLYHYPLFLMIDNQHTGLSRSNASGRQARRDRGGCGRVVPPRRDADTAAPLSQGPAPGRGPARGRRARRHRPRARDHRVRTIAVDSDQGRPLRGAECPAGIGADRVSTSTSSSSATPSP